MKIHLLEPAWLREHEVARIERLWFSAEGVVSGRVSYGVDASGEMKRVYED